MACKFTPPHYRPCRVVPRRLCCRTTLRRFSLQPTAGNLKVVIKRMLVHGSGGCAVVKPRETCCAPLTAALSQIDLITDFPVQAESKSRPPKKPIVLDASFPCAPAPAPAPACQKSWPHGRCCCAVVPDTLCTRTVTRLVVCTPPHRLRREQAAARNIQGCARALLLDTARRGGRGVCVGCGERGRGGLSYPAAPTYHRHRFRSEDACTQKTGKLSSTWSDGAGEDAGGLSPALLAMRAGCRSERGCKCWPTFSEKWGRAVAQWWLNNFVSLCP